MGLFSSRPPRKPQRREPTVRDLRAPAAPSKRSAERPATDTHTLHTFDDALRGLVAKTAEMANHVTGMIKLSGPAFLERDAPAAKTIIQADLIVDKEKEAVLASTVEALARHAPVASDLRLILAAEHVASNLERAADHAKNIAKRTLSLSPTATLEPAMRDLLSRLHTEVVLMFEDAAGAFRNVDVGLAADVLRRDAEPDALYDDLFHAAIAKLQTGNPDPAMDVHALFVGKSLERIGDHATNIAEEVRFLARGDIPPATRRS
jgi:phosphate transport system protein